MAIRCDICGRLSPDRSVRCECGYGFETHEVDHDVALARAFEHQLLARRQIGRGLVLVLLIPIVSVLSLAMAAMVGSLGFIVVAMLIDLLLALGGVTSIALGVTRRVTAGRELRAARERRQLPEARVVSGDAKRRLAAPEASS